VAGVPARHESGAHHIANAKTSKGRRTGAWRLFAYALLIVAVVLLSQIRNAPGVEILGLEVAVYWVAPGFSMLGVAAAWAWQRSRG
jgi:hypothetical protein